MLGFIILMYLTHVLASKWVTDTNAGPMSSYVRYQCKTLLMVPFIYFLSFLFFYFYFHFFHLFWKICDSEILKAHIKLFDGYISKTHFYLIATCDTFLYLILLFKLVTTCQWAVPSMPKCAKVCQSPPSAPKCQSPPSVPKCQSPPSAPKCQSPPSGGFYTQPPWGPLLLLNALLCFLS